MPILVRFLFDLYPSAQAGVSVDIHGDSRVRTFTRARSVWIEFVRLLLSLELDSKTSLLALLLGELFGIGCR